ncbi:hypothetical protein GOBAR_DD02739 [Gossypium barbadense]|nr:hypothetical protein GOBAR_DD02739 [Gossypium barbadense]
MEVRVENGGSYEVGKSGWDGTIISEDLVDSLEFPVIDFSFLAKGGEDEVQKLQKLHLACKDWGFFQVINHGVKEEILEKIKAAVAAFFELPFQEKKKYAMAENETEGYGQNFVVSEHQKHDWSGMIYLLTLHSQNRNFKFWPLSLPGFKEALEEYSREMQKLAEELQANFSVLMGLKRDGLKRLQGGGLKQGIRMNYYPICSRPDLVLECSPHSDGTSFTLLLQDDDVTGLQIKHNEAWVPVKPIPNSLVVNIGDATEVIYIYVTYEFDFKLRTYVDFLFFGVQIQSNGMYKSIEHRAIINEKKPRISIATFMFPDDEQEIGPVETMIDDQNHPKLYRNIKYVDYVREKFSRKMEGKAHFL